MEERLTWWQGTLVIATVSTAAVTVWAALKSKEAAEKALASLEGPPAQKISGPPISVIIPTWNEADYLTNLLTSLGNQTYEPLEVIVADWNSTDATREVAASFGAAVVDVPERGVGPARNAGAQAATGDFFLFIDADNVLEPSLVQELMVELLANDRLLAHPRIAFYEDGIFPAMRWLSSTFTPCDYTSRCILIRRETFETVGGFPNIWREDLWLGRTVKQLFGGEAVAYLSYAICATSTRREKARFTGRVKQVTSPEFPAVRNEVYYG